MADDSKRGAPGERRPVQLFLSPSDVAWLDARISERERSRSAVVSGLIADYRDAEAHDAAEREKDAAAV